MNKTWLVSIVKYEKPFEKVDLGDGIELKFNTDILNSDFVVDLPVLKTHSMTVVSLGIKNLKGMIDIPSRKKCHNTDPEKDLHFMIAKLADTMPPIFTLLDGIYTAERGPNIDGRMHRSNLLVASADVLSADMVGAKVLGYMPSEVPHLVHAAHNHRRPLGLSDVAVVGEPLEAVAKLHKYDFPYNKDQTLPLPMEKMGIKGCPPQPKSILKALHQAGIQVDPAIFENIDKLPGRFFKRYEGKPEFDEAFFQIK